MNDANVSGFIATLLVVLDHNWGCLCVLVPHVQNVVPACSSDPGVSGNPAVGKADEQRVDGEQRKEM